MKDNHIKCFVTFFGAGNFPVAPGTAGTFAALPLYALLRKTPPAVYGLTTTTIAVLGAVAAGRIENEWGKDPSRIVIDEVAGVLTALAARPSDMKKVFKTALVFRFFDILKPPPVNILDQKVPGGTGVMADDIAAGLMSAAVMYLLERWGR